MSKRKESSPDANILFCAKKTNSVMKKESEHISTSMKYIFRYNMFSICRCPVVKILPYTVNKSFVVSLFFVGG
jgi:hypothetical protein